MKIEAKITIHSLEEPLDGVNLQELESSLNKNGFSIKSSLKSIPQGRKAVDIITGMTVAGLALLAIGTLISSLAYWKSTRPLYRIVIRRGPTSAEIRDVISAAELAEMVKVFSNSDSVPMEFEVSKVSEV